MLENEDFFRTTPRSNQINNYSNDPNDRSTRRGRRSSFSAETNNAYGGFNPYIAGSVEPASFFRRLGATLVDSLLAGIVAGVGYYISYNIISTNSNASVAQLTFSAVALNLIFTTIYQIFLIGKFGRTLGDVVTRTRIVNQDMQIPGYVAATKRLAVTLVVQLLAALSLSTFGLVITFVDDLWMLSDKNRQTIHDKIAGTYVIVDPAPRRAQ
ncbi:RDD family protein [Acidithrix ferrooxidans]|uniref:RDD family protein n=1 Tax=Acidithrix ferrooxidans TaxID=1280514 RepID=A0A0D8HH17_9ACTN|nr:RDD family protein [Acidithrix ferrooxidans]ATZ76184.1 RDD family multipass membrane protein [uncultured Acidithrix sp.]KJF16346.1 RDD family protein [Acidithrix ferrooxidans]